MTTRITGGCQCGAVRYALAERPTGGSLCHCRMCQKATGGPVLASANVPAPAFAWTRGAPATFRSSTAAERDFCARCGTPLTFRFLHGHSVAVTMGSLDQPDVAPPVEQLGPESRMAWWDGIEALPTRSVAESLPAEAAGLVSLQHPDHDTDDDWRAPEPA